MDDYFKKEVSPFARAQIGEISENEFQKGLKTVERWKFSDHGLFNRAVGVEWNFEAKIPVTNWTEFQRRAKHLIAVELELETIVDWIIESQDQNIVKLIRVEAEQNTDQKGTFNFSSFWDWDEDIDFNGTQAWLFTHRLEAKQELRVLMDNAMNKVLNDQTDGPLIEVKKQLNDILRSLYDIVICTCPWEGKISGGPMLPNQKITFQQKEGLTRLACRFEFSILGARAIDMRWLKDLKFPALSNSSMILIHHGARREL